VSTIEYQKYRDSGSAWLGVLPTHWEIQKLKIGFELVKRPVVNGDGNVTAFRDGQVTLRTNRRTEGFTEAEKEIGYQGIEPDDLVIHAMDAFAGAIGVSDSRGKSTPVYSVCRPRTGYSSGYFALTMRHIALSGYISSLGKGVRERSTDFRWSDAGEVLVPVPPLAEQRQIADYLDAQTAKIDTLIGKQERLIETLAERRQAVISHAVTKGLDPSAPMKDSGLKSLGNAPSDWRVMRLGLFTSVLTGFPFKSDEYSEDDSDIRLLRGANVNPQKLVWEEVAYWPRNERAAYSTYELELGDLILGLDRPIVSSGTRVAMVRKDDLPALLLQRVARIRVTAEAAVEFLAYLLSGPEFRDYLAPIFTGVSVPHMSPEQLKSFRIALPPKTEQHAIVAYLDRETSQIDALSAKARQMIDVLKERRQALISAAVTGKIDVRGLS
jgi:type I restriction enzyme S subunit